MPAVDTSFFSTYGIALLEGRIFSTQELMTFRAPKDQDELIQLVVNEAFVSRLGIQDPKDALSERLKFWWGPEERRAEIIGVVADHHQRSFKEHVEPVAYMQPAWADWKYFSVNVKGDLYRVVAKVESAYKQVFPDNAVSRFFLDEFFDRQYKEDIRFGRIFNVFTVLAIAVTCMGLLGLSVFSVTQRAKEVGVRKVLGASSWMILYFFSKDFVKLLIIAYVITVPLIYWAGDQWLNNFTFRIPLGWQLFVLPPLLLTFITLTTISIISIRAALESPVRALRQE
jgi:putative ABC transport system permease protein